MEPSWAVLGASWGRLGMIVAPSWGDLGASWWRLGAILGRLGSLLALLGGVLALFGGHDPTTTTRGLRVLKSQETCLGFTFETFLDGCLMKF